MVWPRGRPRSEKTRVKISRTSRALQGAEELELAKIYEVGGFTAKELAQVYGFHSDTIWKALHRADCQFRRPGARKGFYSGSKNVFYGRHHSKETRQKISASRKNFHHSAETKRRIGKAQRGHSVTAETRRKISEAQSGDKSPHWKGGRSRVPYPIKFDRALKRKVRQRDCNTCQLCKKIWANGKKHFSVHHINYAKGDLDPWNLITLCASCNSRVNFSREFWIWYFEGLQMFNYYRIGEKL